MYRHVSFPALLLGAFAVSGCAETPTGGGCTEFQRNSEGVLECVQADPNAGAGNSAGTQSAAGAAAGSSGSGGLTDLNGTSGSSGGLMDLSTPNGDDTDETGDDATGTDDTANPGDDTVTPGDDTVTPGDDTVTPGDDTVTPGDDTATPDDDTVADDVDDVMPDDGSGTDDDAVEPGDTVLANIVVSAGTLARDHSIVRFEFPIGQGKNMALKDEAGALIPLQMDPINVTQAIFVLPTLAASATASYSVIELAQAMPVGVQAAVGPDTTGDQLFLKQGDKTVFRWTLVEDNFRGAQARDVRAGYIYPIYTPTGLNVGDDYQVDHPHMHGMWSAWTKTTFRGHAVDFWNGYDLTGRVDLNGMDGVWSGPVHGGLVANLLHTDITTNPAGEALDEKWVVTVYRTHETAPYYVYDIDSVQQAASTDPLILETYHYGGFGFRGSEQWQDPANVAFLTSEGHNRSQADGQTGRWVAQYGTVDGQRAGYAALGHPTNFRHPQGLRVHPTNPYWAFVPCTQSAGGRFTIEPGDQYHSLFRIVAFDGDANPDLLNKLWDDFATPPTVMVQ